MVIAVDISEHVKLYSSLPHDVKKSLPRSLRPDYSELIRKRNHSPKGLYTGGGGSHGASSSRA